MKDFNIECNNIEEAKYIESYLIIKGYKPASKKILFKNYKKEINFPIIIFKTENQYFFWIESIDFLSLMDVEITEAKYYMRKDKLKRIL